MGHTQIENTVVHPGVDIEELTDFIYACFVGILNQWLATSDQSSLEKTTGNLIEAAQALACKLLPHCKHE